MSEKRKDNRGRILRTGEGQRPNKSYYYRYHRSGSRSWCYVYAPTLEELRAKEQSIQRDLYDGIDPQGGEMSVIELIEKNMNLRRGLKQNTLRAYHTVINRVRLDPFGKRKIKDICLSDAKAWFVSLHDMGMKQNTIGVIQSVVRPAFEMAVDDDLIRKNPFKFKLSDLVPKDSYQRQALTKEQQERYLKFVHDKGGNYYNDIVVLLGTGMRVSELYGLTRSDIDFDRRCIHVRRQLCRTADKAYFITSPKTESGNRTIPMSETVYNTLRNVLEERGTPKVETIVDGCSLFLFLDKDGKPKVAQHLENYMRGVQKKLVDQYGECFPKVTPHVLRHTFCTYMQQGGIDVKSLQYLMGHSNASVTLDVYTHSNYDSAEKAFQKVAMLL